jgi:hypothetical protein
MIGSLLDSGIFIVNANAIVEQITDAYGEEKEKSFPDFGSQAWRLDLYMDLVVIH